MYYKKAQNNSQKWNLKKGFIYKFVPLNVSFKVHNISRIFKVQSWNI